MLVVATNQRSFCLLVCDETQKVLRPSRQAAAMLASLTPMSWLSQPGTWGGKGITICLFALKPNVTRDMISVDTPHLECAKNSTPDQDSSGSSFVPVWILMVIWLCTLCHPGPVGRPNPASLES